MRHGHVLLPALYNKYPEEILQGYDRLEDIKIESEVAKQNEICR